jgi:hypothetical protein
MDHTKAISLLGGTRAAARFFEVTPAAVVQWKRAGIPRARLMYLRVARPDIYEAALNAGDTAEEAVQSA